MPKYFTFNGCGVARQQAWGGFTVIEIMVTVAIIGISSIIVIPSMIKARQTARTSEVESQLEILTAAISQLAWDTGVWPNGELRNATADAEVWNLDTVNSGLTGNNGDFDNWKGPYIRDVPTDPWGNPYFFDPDYRVDGVWRVAVGSFGPNGIGRNQYDEDNVYILLD